MTEFELMEVYHAAEASWQGAVGLFISIVFAYVLAAYVFGTKLTRSQLAVVTGLYLLFGLMMIAAVSDIFIRVLELGREIRELNPGRRVAFGGNGVISLLRVTFFTALFAGLLFMFQIRRADRKRE